MGRLRSVYIGIALYTERSICELAATPELRGTLYMGHDCGRTRARLLDLLNFVLLEADRLGQGRSVNLHRMGKCSFVYEASAITSTSISMPGMASLETWTMVETGGRSVSMNSARTLRTGHCCFSMSST